MSSHDICICFMLQDPCQISPCKNGGTCEVQFDMNYECSCPADIAGSRCQCTYVMQTLCEYNLNCTTYHCMYRIDAYINNA